MLDDLLEIRWARAQTAFELIALHRQAALTVGCIAVLGAITYLLYRRPMAAPVQEVLWLLVVFALLSGLVHAIDAFDHAGGLASLRGPLATLVDWIIIAASLVVWPAVLWIVRQPTSGQLREEIDRQLRTLDELRSVRSELERQVAARTGQLREAAQRFDIVLRQSPISVFSQDRDQRYTWIRNSLPGFNENPIGMTDDELLPTQAGKQMRDVKQLVMESGEAHRTELLLPFEGERRWYDVTVEPLRAVDGHIIGTTSAAIDVTHRKQSELLQEMLLREVTHRSKNLLAVIQAIVRHTSPRTTSGRAYASRLGAHLQAMSITHDMLVEASWHGVSLPQLVRAQLGSHADHNAEQVKLQGDDIVLGPGAADSIGLVIHELADNAARTGALAAPGGTVLVKWWLNDGTDDGSLTLDWLEVGGRPAARPDESGFGRILLEEAIGISLSGEVRLEFQPEGLHCEITLPAYHVIRTATGLVEGAQQIQASH